MNLRIQSLVLCIDSIERDLMIDMEDVTIGDDLDLLISPRMNTKTTKLLVASNLLHPRRQKIYEDHRFLPYTTLPLESAVPVPRARALMRNQHASMSVNARLAEAHFLLVIITHFGICPSGETMATISLHSVRKRWNALSSVRAIMTLAIIAMSKANVQTHAQHANRAHST